VKNTSKLAKSSYLANGTSTLSPKQSKRTATPPNNTIPALFDSACTDTSLRVSSVDAQCLLKATPSNLSLRTAKPGVQIKAMAQVPLNVATFSTKAHVFKNNELDHNLIALADLTNSPNNAECRFHKDGLGIYDTTCRCGNLLAFYPKEPTEKIWSTVPTSDKKLHLASPAIKSQSSYDLVMLYHATFGSPSASTFYRAVKNKWIDIDGLTATKIHQHWPNSLATAQGHLQQTRQGLKSTRPKEVNLTKPKPSHADYVDSTPDIDEEFHVRTFKRSDAIFVDATGRYPGQSIDGFEYHLVSVFKNYIHIELLPDRTAQSYVKAYTDTFAFFAKSKHFIRNVVFDKETSEALENHLTKSEVKFQIVSPGNKRSNKAERAIQTWRHHMIATLGTVNAKCPTNIWSTFIEQMELCLAHLRPFEDDRTLSAYEGLYGTRYDYKAHPLFICGCPVSVFEPPSSRPKWSTHDVQGYYVGPDLSCYRTYRCWIESTKSMRSSDTVQFFPAPFLLPGASYEEQMIAAIDKLIELELSTDNDAIHHAATAVTRLARDIRANTPSLPQDTDDEDSPPTLIHDDDATDGSDQRVASTAPQPPLQRDVQRVADLPTPVPVDPAIQRVPPTTLNPLAARKSKSTKTAQIDSLRNPTAAEKATPSFKQLARRVGQRFTDTQTNETFVIESIQMPLKARGKGSQTPHYVFTDVRQGHLRIAQREKEFTRCAELEKAPYTQWLQPKNAAYAILSHEKYDGRPLNQRADGLKFTVRGEMHGPRSGYWRLSRREEFMRLFDSSTIVPVHRRDIPHDETVTYYNEQPKEKLKVTASDAYVEYRVRGTCGGDRLNYKGQVSSNTAEYPVVKILMNATLSDRIHKNKNTRFATADMVDFYLGTDLDKPSYMQIAADTIGDELLDLYNMKDYIVNINGKRVVYFKVLKCLYGHPAAGRLSFLKLKEILEKADFYEHPFVDCLFVHKTRNITFALIVDDMGIKYSEDEDLQFLVDVISPHWKLKVDITGSKFLGMHLVWQYNRKIPRVIVFNPTVVKNALSRFVAGTVLRGNKTPSPYTKPVYGKHPQMSVFDETAPAPPETIKFVQEVTGLFSHYSRVIDYTMAEAVTTIATTQAAPTEDTIKRVSHLLNYAASHPNNCIIYEASDMILTSQSDASHQSVKNSRSKAGGVFYLANKGDPPTKNNGLLGVYSKIIPVVCAAASDAEYAALFQIAQLMYFYRIVCEACGYPQGPSPIYVDNDVARGIADRSVKVKRSKSIDKSFHYIRDRVELQDLVILRVDTEDNISDFFTKSLPPERHRMLASRIIQQTPAEFLNTN
jgi:hypothetical protein